MNYNIPMNAKVLQRQILNREYLYLELDLLGQALNYKAGQFFSLTLSNPPFTDQRGNSRFFGFVNSPTEENKIAMITRIGVSAYKKSLMEIPIDSEVKLDSVGGHTGLPDDINQEIVLIAGGIGIAPFMSMLRFAREKSLPYKINLIYLNKNKESAVFFDEIESFSKDNKLLKFFPVFSEIESINSDLIKNMISELNTKKYFITGKQSFVLSAVKSLKDLGVDVKDISIEIFTGY
jgi:glycine betaine catabolism B